jgi:hypothetical protein
MGFVYGRWRMFWCHSHSFLAGLLLFILCHSACRRCVSSFETVNVLRTALSNESTLQIIIRKCSTIHSGLLPFQTVERSVTPHPSSTFALTDCKQAHYIQITPLRPIETKHLAKVPRRSQLRFSPTQRKLSAGRHICGFAGFGCAGGCVAAGCDPSAGAAWEVSAGCVSGTPSGLAPGCASG